MSGTGGERVKSKAKRADIQGLRAIAVGLVVLAHSHFPFFDGGFVGVDVFFVLSGFLITGLLINESERSGRISIPGFYARRARRILPAATVVLVAVTVFVALTEPLTRLKVVADDALWSAIFLANVHFADIGTDYFASQDPSPVQHYWSLAVEEQFYLVWPLLLILLVFLRSSRRTIFGALALIWLVSLVWSIWQTNQAPVDAYFSSVARAFELASGALVAVLTPVLNRLRDGQRVTLFVVGLGLVLLASLTFTERTPFPGWLALVPVLGTAALLAAGTGREVGPSKLLGLQPLRHIGDLSFSIYLWHWPVLIVGDKHVPEGLAGTALLLLITLALSELSYFLVEQPFQHGKVPMVRGRWSLVLWPVSLALVAGTAMASNQYGEAELAQSRQEAQRYYQEHPEALQEAKPRNITKALRHSLQLADDGAPLPPDLVNVDHLGRDIWQEPFPCYASFDDTTTKICPAGDVDADRTVVMYGDSHAGMWMPALDAAGKKQGFKVIPLVKVGCAPYDVPQTNKGEAFPTCPEFRDWARGQIEEIQPDAIVLAHRGMLFMDSSTPDEDWATGVRATVEDLATITPNIKVLGDIPKIPWEPQDCVTDVDASMEACTARADSLEIHSNPITRDAVRGTGADYVPTTDLICVDDRCPLVVGDVVTFRDKAHLSLSWTTIISPRFAEMLDLRFPHP
ncbi:acyltransferase family protein [Nocardioides jensenii]|uniref:acyltransferase family protein n=1 Tax=Nocardioides jensenii TaxID=1843 RepID=UPI0008344CB8|nr:acyltransferase family protein [Nocardioides jensenii]